MREKFDPNETVLEYAREVAHSGDGLTMQFAGEGILLMQKRNPTMPHVIEDFRALSITDARKVEIPGGYDYALVKRGSDDLNNLHGESKKGITAFGVVFSADRRPILEENPVGIITTVVKKCFQNYL